MNSWASLIPHSPNRLLLTLRRTSNARFFELRYRASITLKTHCGFLPRMPESLEQLDLLLMQEVRARKVRRDGIHFHGLRYLSLTLAAYVGEDVTIRFDPRDMGEIRVFYKDRFLCPAVSAELAGETIPLRDIVRVRNQRRRELSSILHDRQQMVDSLLQLKKGSTPKEIHASAATPSVSAARIKRYRNE
jgi:putative transposase